MRWSVQLLLTVVVTWFILRWVGLGLEDVRELDLARWRPDGLLLAGSCVALLAGYGMAGVLWGRMVRELGGPPVPVGTAVRIFFIANLGRYIPGKLWQIAGLAVLARQKGVSPAVATGAAVLGQGFALMGASLLGAATLLEAGPPYDELGLWTLGGIVAGVALVSVPRVFRALMGLWFRVTRTEPPEAVRPGPGFALRWLGLYVANWALYAVAFWILVRSFGLDATVMQAAPAFAAAYVLGYAAVFAPAGIGVREGFLTLFLGPVTGVGAAGAVAVLARLWATGVEVVPAGALWIRHLGLRTEAGGEEEGS